MKSITFLWKVWKKKDKATESGTGSGNPNARGRVALEIRPETNDLVETSRYSLHSEPALGALPSIQGETTKPIVLPIIRVSPSRSSRYGAPYNPGHGPPPNSIHGPPNSAHYWTSRSARRLNPRTEVQLLRRSSGGNGMKMRSASPFVLPSSTIPDLGAETIESRSLNSDAYPASAEDAPHIQLPSRIADSHTRELDARIFSIPFSKGTDEVSPDQIPPTPPLRIRKRPKPLDLRLSASTASLPSSPAMSSVDSTPIATPTSPDLLRLSPLPPSPRGTSRRSERKRHLHAIPPLVYDAPKGPLPDPPVPFSASKASFQLESGMSVPFPGPKRGIPSVTHHHVTTSLPSIEYSSSGMRKRVHSTPNLKLPEGRSVLQKDFSYPWMTDQPNAQWGYAI